MGDEPGGLKDTVKETKKASSKKVDSKTGGDGDDDGDGSGKGVSGPEEWLVPRATLFVCVMFVFSAFFWFLSQPRGKPVGWATLKELVQHIEYISLYEQYAQVYFTDGPHRKVYIGLVDPKNTQEHIEELRRLYQEGRKRKMAEEAKRKASAKKTTEDEEEEEDQSYLHPELHVVWRGKPLSESVLSVFGVFAWMVPFVFFPIYVMILSSSITRSVAQASMVANQSTNKAKMTFKVEPPAETRFRDVAGMKEPKAEITEIVDFLRHPQRYTALGAKIPTGALLLGPPGTGKTLLAKAVSGESGVSFIPVCGSDFVELYAGMGAKRVRELFELAKKQRCIIYIDEIDAIGLKRQGAGHGEKQEQEHTLNELLTQLDGFATEERAGDIILLASSNVPLESLDPALVRPGRFDRIIHVDAPVKKERVEIFKVHLSQLKLVAGDKKADESEACPAVADEGEGEGPSKPEKDTATPNTSSSALVVSPPPMTANEWASFITGEGKAGGGEEEDPFDISIVLRGKSEREKQLIESYAQRMSDLCPGFVGSDVANVCNEAAILAAQENAGCVDISHLERSVDRVLAGIEHRSRVLSDFEKRVVAHHEAGHAVAGWFLNRASPLMKVSIVPRGGSALGYAQYLPNENRNQTAQELRDAISVSLGGRIAEEIFFGHLSTGASDDLRKVRHMAYQYVTAFSRDASAVYPTPDSESLRYRKPYGTAKADLYDMQAKSLVDSIYRDTKDLLVEHKEHMSKLAEHLLKEEVLTHLDVVRYLGKRPDRDADRKKRFQWTPKATQMSAS